MSQEILAGQNPLENWPEKHKKVARDYAEKMAKLNNVQAVYASKSPEGDLELILVTSYNSLKTRRRIRRLVSKHEASSDLVCEYMFTTPKSVFFQEIVQEALPLYLRDQV